MEGTNNKQTNRKNITITSSSSSSNDEGMMFIRKGPWKAEEDQVLLNHVKKYGPRDWSSIRSKGLLQRTGKSCRLRWVNKLRPNLKNGCKFTAEEERVVIEMQAQLGNKWATIATQLPGRTDNDVKNFWSSRQKRLARLLHSQSPSGLPHKSHKPSISSLSSTSCTAKSPPEVPKSNSVMEGETSYTSPDTTKMILPSSEMVNQNSVNSEANKIMVKLEPTPLNKRDPAREELQFQEMPFPPIPNLQTDLFPFPPETQELIDRLDSSFLGPLGCTDDAAFLSDGAHLFSCFGGGDLKGDTGVKGESDLPVAPDSFFDDFPSDMFDQIEPLPSPSGW